MPQEIISAFESQFNSKVIYDSYFSNEELVDKMLVGGDKVYDVIFPTDWYVSILKHLNKLNKLDKSLIPNWRLIKKEFLGGDFDKRNEYSLPYQWGVTVIAYRSDCVKIDNKNLEILFNPPEILRYKIGLIDDAREIIGQALLYRNRSVNTNNIADLLEAQKILLKIKPFVHKIGADIAEDLVTGEIWLAVTWQGEALHLQRSNPNVDIYVPKEGAVIDYDTLAIPINAPNKKLAHLFINFLLDPQINAKISAYTSYSTPVAASMDYLSRQHLAYTDSETLIKKNGIENVEFIKDVGNFISVINKIWGNFKQP